MEWDWWSIFQTGIGTVLGFGAAIGLAPTGLGDKLHGHIFDRKLNALKHEQDTKIEGIRARLSVIGDRGVRANEGEFAALTAAWNAFISASVATKVCALAFTSHPDFGQMDDGAIAAFLTSTDLSEVQRNQVMAAKDRSKMYYRVFRFIKINQAGQAIFDAREVVRKQGIFFSEKIEAEFESALGMFSAAQVHESLRLDYGADAGRDATGTLFKDGDKIVAALKMTVRNRLTATEVA